MYFCFFCFMLFFKFFFMISFYVSFCLCLMFSPSLFKLFHLQSKNTYKNKNTKTYRRNIYKTTEKNRNLPAGTWDIFIRGRVEGWILCMFVCFNVCLWVFMFFMFSLFKCFRLAFQAFAFTIEKTHKNRNNRTTLRKTT